MNTSVLALCVACVAVSPALMLVGGCQSGGSSLAGAGDMLKQIDGSWVLEQLGGKDVASMLPKGMKLPELNFGSDGSVSGFGGVNRLTSELDPKDLLAGKLDLSKMASTKMAGPPEAMNLESQFTSALQKVRGFRFDKAGGLNLTDGKDALMRLVRGG